MKQINESDQIRLLFSRNTDGQWRTYVRDQFTKEDFFVGVESVDDQVKKLQREPDRKERIWT